VAETTSLGIEHTLAAAWFDGLALGFFVVAWAGYSLIADQFRMRRNSLMDRMHEYRLAWVMRMLTHDNRIPDVQVITILVNNVSFFASSAILIIGALAAALGASDVGREVVKDSPFAGAINMQLWDLKIAVMIAVFVYAFFKFTWSIRQFNYVAVLVGAMPVGLSQDNIHYARRTAELVTRAGDHFNRAMRAYYFAAAVLAWFILPSLFIVTTLIVVLILYRREFHSKVLSILGPCGEPIATDVHDSRQAAKS